MYISNSIKFILQKRSYSWDKFRIMLTRMLIEKLISSSLQSTFKVQGLTSLLWDGEEDGNILYWVCRHWTRLSHTLSHLILLTIL